MTSLCELGESDHGGSMFRSSISPIPDFKLDSDYGSDEDEDLVDTILALLDDQNFTSSLCSPRYPLASKSTPPSIKKWVEGLPGGSVVTPSSSAIDSFSTPRNSVVYQSPSISSCSPESSSIFSQTDDERKAWSLRISSQISEPPTQELPALPTEVLPLPTSRTAKSGEIIEFGLQNYDVTPTPKRNSAVFIPQLCNKRMSSMPRIKERASMVASITIQTEHSQTPTVTEFKFPLPPPFNWPNLDNGSRRRQCKSLPSRHLYAKALTENEEDQPASFLTNTSIESSDINSRRDSTRLDGNSRAGMSLRPSSPLKARAPYNSHTHSRSRSRSLTQWASDESCAEESILNHKISCPSRQPRIASLLKPNKLHSIVEGDVFAVASLIEAGDRSDVSLIGHKRDPLDECLVFGSRTRFLQIRRRSLSGTKVEWLVSDNGVVEHVNARARADGKKLLLKCLSDALGKVGA
ncbi:hypothetical protein K3495_g10824 [Podosphaera aphanis]|nr:hypothetical protein K3495_g10824 [Podosphaera aphanis]